jgi:hypothetical protein
LIENHGIGFGFRAHVVYCQGERPVVKRDPEGVEGIREAMNRSFGFRNFYSLLTFKEKKE